MSEGWNIAVLGATGAVGEALFETLADRQFPVGIFMPWLEAIALGNICAFRASRLSYRMRPNSTGPRSSWPFLPPASKRPRRISTTLQTRAAW